MNEPQPPKDPLRAFTFAGRLLLVATLVVAGGVLYWNYMFVSEHLPAHHYPLAFLLIPVVIGAAIFFILGSTILKLVGIRVWKKPDDHDKSA